MQFCYFLEWFQVDGLAVSPQVLHEHVDCPFLGSCPSLKLLDVGLHSNLQLAFASSNYCPIEPKLLLNWDCVCKLRVGNFHEENIFFFEQFLQGYPKISKPKHDLLVSGLVVVMADLPTMKHQERVADLLYGNVKTYLWQVLRVLLPWEASVLVLDDLIGLLFCLAFAEVSGLGGQLLIGVQPAQRDLVALTWRAGYLAAVPTVLAQYQLHCEVKLLSRELVLQEESCTLYPYLWPQHLGYFKVKNQMRIPLRNRPELEVVLYGSRQYFIEVYSYLF